MALRVSAILGLDGSGFYQGLNRAESSVNRFGRNVASSIGTRLAGLFSVGATGMFVRNVVNYAGKLNDMADRTGRNVEELQRLDRAAIDNGTTLETLINFWERLGAARQAALKNQTGPQAAAFKAFGISQESLKTDAAADITRSIAEQFKNSTNAEQLTAPLRDIGGRGVGQLVSLFRSGLDQMYQDITVMSSGTAETLDDLADSFEGFQKEMMSGFAPFIVKAIDGIKTVWDYLTALFTGIGVLIGSEINGTQKEKTPYEVFGDAFTQSLIEDAEKRADEEKAKSERRAQRRNRGALSFEPFTTNATQPQDKYNYVQRQFGGMVNVGNFLGANRSMLETIGSQQISWLIRIERNTKKMADTRTDDSLDLPPE